MLDYMFNRKRTPAIDQVNPYALNDRRQRTNIVVKGVNVVIEERNERREEGKGRERVTRLRWKLTDSNGRAVNQSEFFLSGIAGDLSGFLIHGHDRPSKSLCTYKNFIQMTSYSR